MRAINLKSKEPKAGSFMKGFGQIMKVVFQPLAEAAVFIKVLLGCPDLRAVVFGGRQPKQVKPNMPGTGIWIIKNLEFLDMQAIPIMVLVFGV